MKTISKTTISTFNVLIIIVPSFKNCNRKSGFLGQAREKWEQYWKEKLGIKGYFDIQIQSVELSP
jgi:hypothetical protein